MNNRDDKLINDFGVEWKKFNQKRISLSSNKKIFNKYFSIFPWKLINKNSICLDLGGGSGRWSFFIANKVKKIYFVEPSSQAIEVAKKNLSNFSNIEYHNNDAGQMMIKNESIDFCFCLGVLHHIPNIYKALIDINKKLKKNAPFLIYIYYAFDNRPMWFRILWKLSDSFRIIISRLPFFLKGPTCDIIALTIYLPISRIFKILKFFGFNIKNFPLSFYANQKFYVLRNDALDRFGTKIEQRLTKKQITDLLQKTGFNKISFSKKEPYWCAICFKEKSL